MDNIGGMIGVRSDKIRTKRITGMATWKEWKIGWWRVWEWTKWCEKSGH